jgi:KDO transferase-3
MGKLRSIMQRIRLGAGFRHQYACHPAFDLQRHADHCTVLWRGRAVGRVGLVGTLKDRFAGDCFTIAAGPSLREVALDRLAPHDCFSLNCAIRKFGDAGMRPRHCVIVDRKIFENHWPCVRDSITSGALCFFSAVGLSRICEREPGLLGYDNIFLIEAIERRFGIPGIEKTEFFDAYRNDPDVLLDAAQAARSKTIGFSLNAEKGFFPGKTVATWAVQLARYLGYRSNYILGMDLGGTGKAHFYDDKGARPPDFLKDYDPYIRVAFELARRAADQQGFEIFNLSSQSTLPAEIIPKISLEQALARASTPGTFSEKVPSP